MYEKILVPLDGSQLAEVALPYAEEIAAKLGAHLILLSVVESTEAQNYHNHQIYIQQKTEDAKYGAERYLEKWGGKAVKIESAFLVGYPAEEIVDYADKEGIGLIVIATHGRSGIRRWSLGSVADKVVRSATQPVAIIRAKDTRPDVREKDMLNKILVPLDGSKESEDVIPYIEEFTSKLKAEVILLHVLERAQHIWAGNVEATLIPYTEKEMEPLKANTVGYLEKVGKLFRDKGITTSFEVRVGTPAEEIVNLADEISVDLVAMTTHGRSGVSRWYFGSVADKVLHTGNTPLLFVRVPEVAAE